MPEIGRTIVDTGHVFYPIGAGKTIADNFSGLSRAELRKIMRTGTNSRKAYAFWAYCKNPGKDYKRLFMRFAKDTNTLISYEGSIGMRSIGLNEIILNIAANQGGRYGDHTLYDDFLDRLAVNCNSHEVLCSQLERRLLLIEPKQTFYKAIRKKAMADNSFATIALARFQKLQDTVFVHRLLDGDDMACYIGLSCVREFPHSTFLPKIRIMLQHELTIAYSLRFSSICLALFEYSEEVAMELLSDVLTDDSRYYNHVVNLWQLINMPDLSNHPVRQALIDQVGLEELERRAAAYDPMEFWKKANQARE